MAWDTDALARPSAQIGIVVAAHNAERYLTRTLESISEQTVGSWVCVVVDDGSTDATSTIATRYAARDPRFRFVRQRNRGPCVARNIGFGRLPGSVGFVTFMDADDVWVPHALERLLEAVVSTGSIGAHGLGDFIDDTGKSIDPGAFSQLGRSRVGSRHGWPRSWPLDEPTTFENLVVKSTVFPPGLVLARAAAYRSIGLFDPTARFSEDLDLLLRLTRLGPLTFVDEVLIGYRRHAVNVGARIEVPRAVAEVRRRTFYSAENTDDQRALLRDGWRASQVLDAAARVRSAAGHARRGEYCEAAAQVARLPLIGSRYLQGHPRRRKRRLATKHDVRPLLRTIARRALPETTARGRYIRRLRRPTVGTVLARYAASHPRVTFVQIGSHDGQTGDPLCGLIDRCTGWSGVMVEPTPHHFASLQAHRGSDRRFRLIRAAVTTHRGDVEMLIVDADGSLPWWADQTSTLDDGQKRVLEQHPGLAGHLRTIEVPAVTFDDVTSGLQRIDLLHIDTEGHDAVILDQVDLDRWAPDLILFEHGSLKDDERRRCVDRIRRHGYWMLSENQDTLCVHPRSGLTARRAR